jgi:hypothetical protein
VVGSDNVAAVIDPSILILFLFIVVLNENSFCYCLHSFFGIINLIIVLLKWMF